jgi:hypothetical protein
MGFQPLGIGVQIDVAGTGDIDIGFLSGRDVGIAAAHDVHHGDLGREFAHVHITGSGDGDFGMLHLAVGLDVAGAGDVHAQHRLIELLQGHLAGSGDGESAERPAGQGHLQHGVVIFRALLAGDMAVHFYGAVPHPEMGEELRIAGDMQSGPI